MTRFRRHLARVALLASTGLILAFFGSAPAAASPCVPGATTLCIDGRFQVRVSFHTSQAGGRSGDAQAIGLQSLGVAQGGLFWFFAANDPEMLIKVLDGCALTGHYWVFYAATTNVGFTVTVADTQTGNARTYQNADLTAAPPVQDTAALACGGSAPGATLYVATDGNDAWSGTLPAPNAGRTDGPFASPARAQQAVQALAGSQAVTVQLRGGTYYLPLSPTNPGTLVFSARDSGTASFPINWESYPGETPILSGGVPVGSGGLGLTWNRAGGGNLWQVQLPATVKPFEALFYTPAGGATTRRLRSRLESPSGVGYAMIGGQCTAVNALGPPTAVPASFCNLGTFLRVAGSIPQSAATCTAADSASDGKGHTKCPTASSTTPPTPSPPGAT